jgi:phosphoribosylglycinamide formyltransferase-1
MYRILIFASGSGTNAENIIKYFKNSSLATVNYVISNNSGAGVLERAKRLGVPSRVYNRGEISSDSFLKFLKEEADFIVLAGFLLKVPDGIIEAFPESIINIHPALLPKYGGKGMYGMHVHQAVVTNKEPITGITIHYVNENYDEGAIIFQKSVKLEEGDTADEVAAKIHALEQENFPRVIEEILKGKNEG